MEVLLACLPGCHLACRMECPQECHPQACPLVSLPSRPTARPRAGVDLLKASRRTAIRLEAPLQGQALDPPSCLERSRRSAHPREMAVDAQKETSGALGRHWPEEREAQETGTTWTLSEKGRRVGRGIASRTGPGRKWKAPADASATEATKRGETCVESGTAGKVDERDERAAATTDETVTGRETTTRTKIGKGKETGRGRETGRERTGPAEASALAVPQPTVDRRNASTGRRWCGSRTVRASSCASETMQTASETARRAAARPGAAAPETEDGALPRA